MSAVASRTKPGAALLRNRAAATAAAAVGVLAAAAWLSVEGHAGQWPDALPDIAWVSVATVLLLAVTGYAPARLLTPREMWPHLPLVALALGAVSSSFALTLLGFARVPFELSLGLVIGIGLASAVLVRSRLGPARAGTEDLKRAGGLGARLLWPLFLAAVVAGLTLMPSLRIGDLTVPGENPDAHLVTGAAEVVRVGPPTEIQPELPVDRVSEFWQSKYPIYYSLAAVSELAGLDPAKVFPILSAAILGLFLLGIFLLAYYFLRASPRVALLAMGLVALDRVVLYLADHPYYNQLWGTFALPFMLLFGFRFLREPDRRSAVLVLVFVAMGVFAYPLMLPFPAVALGVAAVVLWRRKRAAGEPVRWLSALRLPDLRASRALSRRWVVVPLALVVAGVAAFLALGAVGKLVDAAEVIVPWGDLNGWQGDSPDYPLARYFGLFGVPGLSLLLLIALGAAGAYALRSVGRAERIGVAAMLVSALAMGLYFHVRTYGEYFEFKILAFAGPIVLLLAVVGLAELAGRPGSLARRAAALTATCALAVTLLAGAREELDSVAAQSPPEAFELRGWAAALPPDASIRLDIPPSGDQLWAAYMLHERPLSATTPVIKTTYPHVPGSRKADYVLIGRRQATPAEAVGAPVRENSRYRLYRLDPTLPGPDRSSRIRIQP